MKTTRRRMLGVSALMALALGFSPQAHAEWLKGNTHCHTSTSPDSNTPIEALMAWYKANGYDFIILTDHNEYTDLEDLNALEAFDEALGRRAPLVDADFTLIPGEELTTEAHHVNGLDIPSRLTPGSTIGASFEIVWANGGLAQLNHPEWNFLQARDIIEEIAELDGPMFLEIYNSHPSVIERSGPSSEDIWDGILQTGKLMWGVGVDDAHTLVGGDKPPGGGFIYVEAASHSRRDIIAAMEAGRLYASTGATLADFGHTATLYEVDAPGATSITFLGRGGRVLERVEGDFGSYRFRGEELYVRARVESPQGLAWTQPVFVGELPDNDPPEASLEADVTEGVAPLTVGFDASASRDPDGQLVSWRWDFGDGSTGRGEVIAHTWDQPGTYTASLTVFDDQGDLDRASITIRVADPDTGEIPDPPDDTPDGTPDDGQPDDTPRRGVASANGDEGCATTGSPLSPVPCPGAALVLGAALLARARRRRGD